MEEGGNKQQELILGKRIQEFRHKSSLTQQGLCHKANLSYSTLAKIERGAIRSPSIFTVQSIAEALSVSIDNLVGANPALPENRKLNRTRSGVSFIYFDVNGCIVRFYQRAFSRIAEDNGIPSDLVETAFWHYNDEACRGTLSLEEFNKQLAEKLRIDKIDWKTYYLEAAEAMPGMSELLNWAIDNYKIGLLTNIMPGLLTALKSTGQVPNIAYDAVVDSSTVGVIKPEKKMYEIATDRAGCDPAEILLIDDTRANLSAAEKMGWHVLWFDYARPEESVAQIREALQPA